MTKLILIASLLLPAVSFADPPPPAAKPADKAPAKAPAKDTSKTTPPKDTKAPPKGDKHKKSDSSPGTTAPKVKDTKDPEAK